MNELYHEFLGKSIKIFFIAALFFLADHALFAQSGPLPSDTLTSKVVKAQSGKSTSDNDVKEVKDNQALKDNNISGSKSIKQVKSARPDMSKSRGARPPKIVRPSGSRIPKGVGRPGGAVRPGRK